MARTAGGVDEDKLYSVIDRLQFLETLLLPEGPTLHRFVKLLQRDAKAIANTYEENGYFLDAFDFYHICLDLQKYLRGSRFDEDCALKLAQCSFQIAKRAANDRVEAMWYLRGAKECENVLAKDPNNVQAEVLPVIAMHDIFTRTEIASPSRMIKLQSLCDQLNSLSPRAHRDPEIVRIRTRMGFRDPPAPSSPILSEEEGAVGGVGVGTHTEKSKKSKKKKGKKKGRRSRQKQPTDAPRTRGAKKKRARKRYKTISVAPLVQSEDDLVQEEVHTRERRSKSESVAELDLNFDSPIELNLGNSDSSEADSDSDKDEKPTRIEMKHTTNKEEEHTFSDSTQLQGWEIVSHRNKGKSSNQRSTSALPRNAKQHYQRQPRQRQQRQGKINSQQNVSTPRQLERITPRMKESLDRLLTMYPGSFTFLCNICLTGEFPQMTRKHHSASYCNRNRQHRWDASKVMVHLSKSSGKAPVRVRPRPSNLNTKARICWHVSSLCWSGDKCKFAHHEIERQVWDLGRINHEVIVKHYTHGQACEGFCCSYCDRSFIDRKNLEDHINTEDHKSKITSDSDRPWRYRDPPPNVINGVYTLCPSAKEGTCHFSNADPSENPCPKAHSEEELKEWQDRHSYRKMKMKKAKMQKLFSFMDDLLAEYNFSMSENEVMTEEVPKDVQVECKGALTQHINEADHAKNKKNPTTFSWKFSIRSSNELQLKRVGLLHDTYRTHFYLSSPKNAQKPQTCPGRMIETQRDDANYYHINVIFESRMLGSFKQWIVFDFDTKPVLVRKLSVSIGADYENPQQSTLPAIWDSSNSRVIRYHNTPDKEARDLEARYKLSEFSPDMNKDYVKLSASNYKHVMHHMLRLEEMEYKEKLSSFNTVTSMGVKKSIMTESLGATNVIYAQDGQLFGLIDITQPIFGDSEASQIALTNVRFVLLKFNASSSTVYEAAIVNSEEGDQTKEVIFVRLSFECVSHECLNDHIDSSIPVGVQFCVDRLQFCRMHLAVDRLTNLDAVFASKNKHPALICRDPNDDNEHMNSRQQAAVRFIESRWSRQRGQHKHDKPELLLVYGPFGTGKTYTLANAVMQTLQATVEPRFLICTHVNSAADLYITDYFDDFVKRYNGLIKMRRIVALMRKITTISEKVRQYVIFDEKNPEKPKELCVADIKDCQIVITTTVTAIQLAAIPELKGHFTHILIDEAGQILETECIIPLALTGSGTCVVLAGDHLQMGPKVYSSTARDMHFHESLLERLFEFSLQKKCRREILLTSNYRTCPEILTFLSKNFYTAAEIDACGNQPKHPLYYPLEFRSVMGNDQVVGNSYVNIYEVLEVGNRVYQILQQWPQEWGPISLEQIGILTPYRHQVQLIRNQLRKQKLRGVFVDRLSAVQGKQFRVIIISTVRTLATINWHSNETQDYLGFLSDYKELNTALTRTQSLVVVVGNPLALCCIGECCNVWKAYIKECENNRSLYPLGVTYKDFHLRSVRSSLNPEAKSFIPAASRKNIAPVPLESTQALPTSPLTFPHRAMSTRRQEVPFNIDTLPQSFEASRMFTGDTEIGLDPTNDETSSETFSSESDEENTDLNKDDMILRELHRQLMLDRRGEDDDDDEEEDHLDTEEENNYIEYQNTPLVMIEESGHVRLDKGEIRDQGVITQPGETQPGETVPCTFRIGRDGRRYAVPKESGKDFEEIHISNNTHRGTALDGDDVLVQILENHDRNSEEPAKVYGMVTDVTSTTNLRDKKIVCRPDPFTDNLMVPIDRNLPKIYVLRPQPSRPYKRDKSKCSLRVKLCRFYHGRATCVREVEVSNNERSHKLFLVRWLQWKRNFHYPLGIVTDELPQGDNLDDGLKILKQIYNVSESHHTNIDDEFPEDWVIPREEINNRKDLRDRVIFTIDPPDSQDLDDALSIEQLPNGMSEIGVHIADVGFFVRIGSKLDEKARARATSFYPSFSEPIHMLPPQLSANLCSLLPNQDRLTISVFFPMNQMGNVDDQNVRIEHSIIASSARLSYEDAENIISGRNIAASNEIRIQIAMLHELAAKRRKQRLQDERYSHDGTADVMLNFRAHYLVEEMMLIANELVARFLVKTYPDCTPIRRQPNPDTEPIQDWQRSNSHSIASSISLSRRCDMLTKQCGDNMDLATDASNQETNHNTVSITKEIWQDIVSANQDDFIRLAGIVSTDQFHPQFAPIRSALHKLLKPAEYFCSGMTTMRSHGNLDVDVYTHFTSPIRRYIDIVVHRQLSAAILGNRTPKHGKEDVNNICHTCNIQSAKAREFELKARALHLAVETMQRPVQTLAYIEEISSKLFQVTFQPDILPALRNAKVSYNLLKPIECPEVEQGGKKISMKWKERIYSLKGVHTLRADDIRTNQRRAVLCLDTYQRFTYQIPIDQWQEIQQAIAMEDIPRASQAIGEVDTNLTTVNGSDRDSKETVQEVTCEIATDDIYKVRKQYVTFQRPFAVGDVVEVQLHSSKAMGVLSPCVQLLNITPSLDFCLEHRANPVQCFANVSDHLPSRKNIVEYKKTWMPIIEMEAAYSSVAENNNVIIHNIKIEWQFQENKSPPCGSFSLPKTFCEARHMDYEKDSAFKHAWLCLRYTDLEVPTTSHKPEEIYVEAKTPRRISHKRSKLTFVAHASIQDVSFITNKKDNTKDRVTIFFELSQMTQATFPRNLLKPIRNECPECSVEFIPYNYPSSRLRRAVESVDFDNTPALIQDICLLKSAKDESNTSKHATNTMITLKQMASKRTDFTVPECKFPSPNESQEEALKNALSQEFTLIQGPPGTGKTITGAYLVHFFAQHNKQIPFLGDVRPQILYCGPSNKSVDVIAEYLKEFKVSIVRVYSKGIEANEFPIPGIPKPTGKFESHNVEMDQRHKNISLHHLIRKKSNPFSHRIREYDDLFKKPGYQANQGEIKSFKKLITEAEAEELQRYQVVLCTCNAAGSMRIKKGTNIIQCIVDEAGMCSEPETLIPLVTTKPTQIVLIGDHKQLRPIILEPTAKLLQMEISLLERYHKQVNMLKIQYRMHEAICYFPSEAFYERKLVTPQSVKQRRSPLEHRIWPAALPVAFCHSSGPEETLSVRTAEGNEMSKANPQEVEHVVRIANTLVRCGLKPSQIVILSQYQLQCKRITDRLEKCGHPNLSVRTVIQSQGSEWDFVIMSTVRSLPRVEIETKSSIGWRKKYLGFITDENQMNVALTRAKHGLIIVGNKFLLQTHKQWKALIEYYDENNCVINASNFPKVVSQQHSRHPSRR